MRQGITQLVLVLVILVQGILPVAGMTGKVAMAMPNHAMPAQCARMNSMEMGKVPGDCCSPGADCCRITTGKQPVAAWARTMPPRLSAAGLLAVEKAISAVSSAGTDLVWASGASPPYTISLYKAKSAFLI